MKNKMQIQIDMNDDSNPAPMGVTWVSKSFDQERQEMFAIRRLINDQINSHRARYGNKDGIAPDGAYRRYENPLFTKIEAMLNEASALIFAAEKEIFSLPNTPAIEK